MQNCGMKRVPEVAKMKSQVLAGLLLALFFSAASRAQEKAQDRRKFLDPKTQVSDDPRRVVAKARPRGPETTPRLRGARIVEGTGAPSRAGTLRVPRDKMA